MISSTYLRRFRSKEIHLRFSPMGAASTVRRCSASRDLNLSETTFLLPPTVPGATIRLRIFTPTRELQFRASDRLESAFVAREHGVISTGLREFNLEEPIGAVRVRVDNGTPPMIWLMTPPIAFHDTLPHDAAAVAACLRREDLLLEIPCRVVSAGNRFVFLALASREAVDQAEIDMRAFDALVPGKPHPINLFVFIPTKDGAYSRIFVPQLGIIEDPATGPLAAFMREYDLLPGAGVHIFSEQGTKMRRRSFLHVPFAGMH